MERGDRGTLADQLAARSTERERDGMDSLPLKSSDLHRPPWASYMAEVIDRAGVVSDDLL